MSDQRGPPTFGDISNVNSDYEPPTTTTWSRPAVQDDGMEDDEPFTVAHLSTAPGGTVPAAVPAPARPTPFTESVKAPRGVTGRIGPSQQPQQYQPPPPSNDSAALLPPSAIPSSSSAALPAAGVEDARSFPFYNIKRYRTYFNVDTADVLHRIVRSMAYFFKGDFIEHTDENPDLYGPFWIASTLVFVSAAAGNYASYIAWNRSSSGTEHDSGWYYDVDKVGGSMALFYGYVGLVGFALWAALRWFKSSMQLAQVWCTYGYAMAVFVPMALLCIVPAEGLRWGLVGTATLVSGLFLFLNFRVPLIEAAGATAAPVLMVMLGAHAVLGLVLKLYFFHYAS